MLAPGDREVGEWCFCSYCDPKRHSPPSPQSPHPPHSWHYGDNKLVAFPTTTTTSTTTEGNATITTTPHHHHHHHPPPPPPLYPPVPPPPPYHPPHYQDPPLFDPYDVQLSPEVAAAFLLSLDLLRPCHPQRRAFQQAFKSVCHRRSSSFGSVVRGSGDGQGGGGGGGVAAKGGEPAPPYSLLSPNPSPLLPNNPGHPPQHHLQHHHHHHHMPQYQIDPAMRDPGGSLGGVESALKYPDMPLLLPPTPSPSPSTAGATTTIAAATTATATSTAFPSWVPYPLYGPEPGGGGSHNGEGGGVGGSISGRAGGGSGGGRGPVEEELGAYWELLDAEIRPIKPVPTCPESQKIFNEHKEMAAKYLVLQHEIFNLRQRKTNLEEKLSQAEKLERIGNQRYQNKIKELESKKENLSRTRTRLRQQLEQIRARQEEQRQRQQQQQEEDTGGEPSLDLSLTPP